MKDWLFESSDRTFAKTLVQWYAG